MSNDMEAAVEKLVNTLAHHPSVRAIGLSGGKRLFPEPGRGDIDLFVYGTQIPTRDERKQMLASLEGEIEQVNIGELESGHWGQGDCLLMKGVETWLLYFTLAEARAELDGILSGQYLGRLDSYYFPMGRCAMWKMMRAYYDPDGFLRSLKERLAEYPPGLASTVIDHHSKALEDVEDLERAVQRQDVFFYHFALDLALDHFLQALFALNREYFPSRKRSETHLRSFKIKPADCNERLHQVVALGGDAGTLSRSYRVWKRLVQDLKHLAENHAEQDGNRQPVG